jgi:hypothetical protein
MTIGYRFADRDVGLTPADAPPNILSGTQAIPWAPSLTFAALSYCTNNGYLFKTTAGGAGNTSGDGPSQTNLTDASCTWVAVGPLNGLYGSDSAATLPLGTLVKGISPDFGEGEFVYVKFTGTVLAGDTVVYNTYAATATTAPVLAAAVTGCLYGISMAVQASGTFGWIMIRGVHGAAALANGTAAGMVGISGSTAGTLVLGVVTAIAAINIIFGAQVRLAPVGALAFGIVEVRYPTQNKGA